MGSAARFVGQFFPLFLLGALFGKLMEDSGSVSTIAGFMTARLGPAGPCSRWCSPAPSSPTAWRQPVRRDLRPGPHGPALFRAAAVPRRLMPAAVALGTSTFTMSALPGTPAIQNAIPMPFFGTTPFAAPGLGILASAVMLGFGLVGSAAPRRRRAGRARATAPAPTGRRGRGRGRARARARDRRPRVRPRPRPRTAPERRPADRARRLPLVVVVCVNF